VKVWYHVIAALVGLAVAALIVYVVFGNASQQGATQEGAAPGALDAGGALLCGSIKPEDTTSAKSRALALDNQPSLFNGQGPIAAISDKHPDQQDWIARVHAATGLCADEIHIETGRTTISLSAVEGVSDEDMAAYTAATLGQAFTAPFNPLGCPACHVRVVTTIDGTDRVVFASTRAWSAYQFARRTKRQPLTMDTLAQFKAASSYRSTDLLVRGW
jgi:hypothetical protein